MQSDEKKIRMTRIKMKWLVAVIVSFSFSLIWVQASDAAAQTDEHAQHHLDSAPAVATPKAEDSMNMQGMDHSRMNHNMSEGEQSSQQEDMSGMDHGDMKMQGGSAPPDARDPHANSGGYTLDAGAYALPGPRQLRMADEHNFGALMIDRLEHVKSDDADSTTV